jgi:Raf kinase inhibitor-like YbhB/YbcL family protein
MRENSSRAPALVSWVLLATTLPAAAFMGCASSSSGSGTGGRVGGTGGSGGSGGGTSGTGGQGSGGSVVGSGGRAAGTGGVVTAAGGTLGSGGAATGIGGTIGGGGAATATGGRLGAGGAGIGGRGALTLTSTMLTNAGTFLPPHTCAGANQSLPLAWTAGPAGTQSYAIVLLDTDNTRYHWAIWNIAPTVTALPEGLPAGASITTPVSAMQAMTGAGTPSYQGPCPNGTVHTYVFTAYALDVATLPGIATGSMAQVVSAAIQGHVLASGTLSGTSNASRP